MNPHLSDEQIADWFSGTREMEAQRHISSCAECSGEITRIETALTLFREHGYRGSEHRSPVASRRRFAFALAGVATITALAVAATGLFHLRRPAAAREIFVEIPYVVQAAPWERTRIVRMDVPIAALIAAGFKVQPGVSAGAVPADVLLGQDGRALAVGFPEDSNSNY